jgi:hypothetical protein
MVLKKDFDLIRFSLRRAKLKPNVCHFEMAGFVTIQFSVKDKIS